MSSEQLTKCVNCLFIARSLSFTKTGVIFTFVSTARAIIQCFVFAGTLCSKLVTGVTGSQSIMEI